MFIFGEKIYTTEGTDAAFEEAKLLYKQYIGKFEKHEGWELWNHSLSDPSFQSNIIKDHECGNIINMISEAVKQYLIQINHTHDTVAGFDITGAWLTHTVTNESARQHNHGSSDLSGVYYIQSNSDTDGNLYFLSSDSIRTAHKLYQFLGNQHDIPPVENTLTLFPGWMTHATRPHKGDNPRISLSFNVSLQYT